MASLPSYKDIVDLVKKGSTLEAQEIAAIVTHRNYFVAPQITPSAPMASTPPAASESVDSTMVSDGPERLRALGSAGSEYPRQDQAFNPKY